MKTFFQLREEIDAVFEDVEPTTDSNSAAMEKKYKHVHSKVAKSLGMKHDDLIHDGRSGDEHVYKSYKKDGMQHHVHNTKTGKTTSVHHNIGDMEHPLSHSQFASKMKGANKGSMKLAHDSHKEEF